MGAVKTVSLDDITCDHTAPQEPSLLDLMDEFGDDVETIISLVFNSPIKLSKKVKSNRQLSLWSHLKNYLETSLKWDSDRINHSKMEVALAVGKGKI